MMPASLRYQDPHPDAHTRSAWRRVISSVKAAAASSVGAIQSAAPERRYTSAPTTYCTCASAISTTLLCPVPVLGPRRKNRLGKFGVVVPL